MINQQGFLRSEKCVLRILNRVQSYDKPLRHTVILIENVQPNNLNNNLLLCWAENFLEGLEPELFTSPVLAVLLRT